MTRTPTRTPTTTTDSEAPTKPKRTRKKTTTPEAEAKAPEAVQEAPARVLAEVGPASPITQARTAFRYIVFGDLHVSNGTIDRCLRVLENIRHIATQEPRATPVCLGDFWDIRGSLSVRHIERLYREFDRWAADGLRMILIPGNHDQVTLDGTIHGAVVFERHPAVYVATEPLVWEQARLAFLPWRENPSEQEELFTRLPGDGWTIFAHAEVGGARANGGHVAAGRVRREVIEAKARACYLGHYHARQLVGDRTWYIGSPYEQNFGERDSPHGVAIVTHDTHEPAFIDFEDLPKHHRLQWPAGPAAIQAIRAHDIVEVHYPRAMEAEARELLGRVGVLDTRFIPLSDADEATSKLPPVVLTIDQAIQQYVDEFAVEADRAGADLDVPVEKLLESARAYLAAVPEAKRPVPPAAPVVEPIELIVRDFCMVKGSITVPLAERGLTLIRGLMGSGKTSLADALPWALYGTTTPRKPGASNASLRADQVIHDDAASCEVTVRLRLHTHEGSRIVSVTRSKVRGKGAVLAIEGDNAPAGISDNQARVDRVVGLSYDLWRSCVYLGQGAVGSFTIDADKRRKELLSDAFGLAVCELAADVAKKDRASVEARLGPFRGVIERAHAQVEILRKQDFAVEADQWEAQRKADIENHQQQILGWQARVAEIDTHLATAGQWQAAENAYRAQCSAIEEEIRQAAPAARLEALTSRLSAAQTSARFINVDLERLSKSHRDTLAKSQGGRAVCPTCGQAMDHQGVEDHLGDLETDIATKRRELESVQRDEAVIRGEIASTRTAGETAAAEARERLNAAQENLSKASTGVQALRQLGTERESIVRQWEDVRQAIVAKSQALNPFLLRVEENKKQIADLEAKIEQALASVAALEQQRDAADFWVAGFGQRGLPVLVLRQALHELETHANRFAARILAGRVVCRLAMTEDTLEIHYHEWKDGAWREREYTQLSGGIRRCMDLAFSPFALSEMVFARVGVRIPLLVLDELSVHLDEDTKPMLVALLAEMQRSTVLVIDHDPTIKGSFDQVIEMADGKMVSP